jgi:phosphate transport system permease protein
MAAPRSNRRTRRRVVDGAARALAGLCILVALVPLADIILTAVQRGHSALTAPGFFTKLQPDSCSVLIPGSCSVYGGIAAELSGTFFVLVFAAAIAIPVGVVAGMFLSEFGRNRLGRTLSFMVEVLAGVPSIVVGVFIYSIVVVYDPQHVLSATSGGLALAVIMLPLVTRTTEESLKLVPQATREAALALGIPRYRSTLQIILPGGLGGILTGALLAVARAGGEAAPFLIVGFTTRFPFTGWGNPVQPLPVFIYELSESPSSNWQADAWAAVLVLMAIMLALSLTARFFLGRRALVTGGI